MKILGEFLALLVGAILGTALTVLLS